MWMSFNRNEGYRARCSSVRVTFAKASWTKERMLRFSISDCVSRSLDELWGRMELIEEMNFFTRMKSSWFGVSFNQSRNSLYWTVVAMCQGRSGPTIHLVIGVDPYALGSVHCVADPQLFLFCYLHLLHLLNNIAAKERRLRVRGIFGRRNAGKRAVFSRRCLDFS